MFLADVFTPEMLATMPAANQDAMKSTPLTSKEELALADVANYYALEYADLMDKANDLSDEYARIASRPVFAQSPGMYRNPETGVIYRVKMNLAGTNMYAFTLQGQSWKYAGSLQRNNVLESFRMTLAECDEFSVHLGSCCLCGRALTNIKSVGFGMGPVCRKKQAG